MLSGTKQLTGLPKQAHGLRYALHEEYFPNNRKELMDSSNTTTYTVNTCFRGMTPCGDHQLFHVFGIVQVSSAKIDWDAAYARCL